MTPLNIKILNSTDPIEVNNDHINNQRIGMISSFTNLPSHNHSVSIFPFRFKINIRNDANKYYMPLYEEIQLLYIPKNLITKDNNFHLLNNQTNAKIIVKTINVKIQPMVYHKQNIK